MKPMAKERLTGGEMIAEYMKSQGTPFAVGIPGHGCLGLVDAFYEHGIDVVQVRHEQSAAHLADAYFRVTGKPVVAFTSIGPGGCNTTIGVATAYVDSSALIVITGSTHVRWRGHGVLQEIERSHWNDFASILEPVVKQSYEISSLEQLPWVLHNAWKAATTGRPGPVHIDLPMDMQSESMEVELFDDPVAKRGDYRPYANPEKIDEAVDMLLAAENPVILAGGGVLHSGAMKELQSLAEGMAIPVVATMAGKGAFPEDHDLFGYYPGTKGSPVGNDLTSNADVLLALGCRFADETTSSYKPGVSFEGSKTKFIQVDIDAYEVGKNYEVAIPLVADVKAALSQMLNKLDEKGARHPDFKTSDTVQELRKKKQEWFTQLKKQREYEPMTISRLLAEIRSVLPRDAYVVTSAGHTQAALFQEFPIYEPGTHITSGGFSTMGFGLPAAMGVKLAEPERTVIAVEGDGSFLMTSQELATAVQYNIPIRVVLADNQGWISIRDLQKNAYGKERGYATEFLSKKDGKPISPDWVKMAEAYGCWAKFADSPDAVGNTLKEALSIDGPALVVTEVNRKHPTSESPVYGWWDVPKPTYLE